MTIQIRHSLNVPDQFESPFINVRCTFLQMELRDLFVVKCSFNERRKFEDHHDKEYNKTQQKSTTNHKSF